MADHENTSRKLRFSERKKLASEGTLGPLEFDIVPPVLLSAVAYKIKSLFAGTAGIKFQEKLAEACMANFGFYNFVDQNGFSGFLQSLSPDRFLDFCEMAVEQGAVSRKAGYSASSSWKTPWPNAESDLNEYFERHRFGYRIENKEARRLDSPALEIAIIRPALFAVQKEGWHEVERTYSEALDHQRGGNDKIDDSITAAYSALESALKASGYKGKDLKALARDFRSKEFANRAVAEVPELIEKLLTKVGATRHAEGNAHGKNPDSSPGKRENASLLIHWVGAFIVFLHDRSE